MSEPKTSCDVTPLYTGFIALNTDQQRFIRIRSGRVSPTPNFLKFVWFETKRSEMKWSGRRWNNNRLEKCASALRLISKRRSVDRHKVTLGRSRMDNIFLKVPRSGGEPGIFLIFAYFLSQAAP